MRHTRYKLFISVAICKMSKSCHLNRARGSAKHYANLSSNSIFLGIVYKLQMPFRSRFPHLVLLLSAGSAFPCVLLTLMLKSKMRPLLNHLFFCSLCLKMAHHPASHVGLKLSGWLYLILSLSGAFCDIYQ